MDILTQIIAMQRYLAARRFPDASVGAHVIMPNGRVAGRIDECKDGRIRGWVYDRARPCALLDLDIYVDGVPVERIVADAYRDDLSKLLKDDGIHGFECVVEALRRKASSTRMITIRLADRPNCVLGPVEVAAEIDGGGLAIASHSEPFEMRSTSLLYDMPLSAIAGIGQFMSGPRPSDEEEQALMTLRLERALIEARYQDV